MECTPDYGDCGCDNCAGDFEDISQRVDQFDDRLRALGWERTKERDGVWWEFILEPDPDREGMDGPEFAGALCPFFSIHLYTTGLLYLAGINYSLERSHFERHKSSSDHSEPATHSKLNEPCFGTPCDIRNLCLATRSFRDMESWRSDTYCRGKLEPPGVADSACSIAGMEGIHKEVVYNGGASFESSNLALWDLGSVAFVVTL